MRRKGLSCMYVCMYVCHQSRHYLDHVCFAPLYQSIYVHTYILPSPSIQTHQSHITCLPAYNSPPPSLSSGSRALLERHADLPPLTIMHACLPACVSTTSPLPRPLPPPAAAEEELFLSVMLIFLRLQSCLPACLCDYHKPSAPALSQQQQQQQSSS